MNKTDSNKFLTFLKIFCYMFSLTFVLSIMVSLIFNHLNRDISSTIWFTFIFSISYSFFSIEKYTKYSTKIMCEEITNKDIIIEIQKIMEKLHWSMVKNDSEQIIFKSSVVRTLWREYLVVTINQNGLELVGSKYFVEKLIKKIKV
ncbi:hypothetical protein [Clostridium tagluense]|uniref:hypothetical protein n=1 Tax=Clostridium tagluense TaxID=360422 RepID=UPI001C0B3C73|nr:hypothetical protein [Clostridium tagluense]MBU3130190.1 hypothetical protein [Clostridium tagluense]